MISVSLKDSAGTSSGAEMHERDQVSGQVVYTREFAERVNVVRPLTNEVYGGDLAQNASFGGTPVNIHDGGDAAGWTGTAVAGTWDFADTTNPSAGTKCVSLTAGNNNDTANFAGTTIAGSSYTAVSMQVRLETYSPSTSDIIIRFLLAGVQVGVEVVLDDYINTTTIGEYQTAAIPLTDFGVENLTFDECDIIIARGGGAKPTFRIDQFQIEETGGALRFEVEPTPRTVLYVHKLILTFVDNVTGNAALDYTKILGATLSSGLILSRQAAGVSRSTLVATSAGDLYRAGFSRRLLQDDGTNTLISFELVAIRPFRLNSLYGDKLSVDINDDLSGLILGTAVIHGEEETINGGRKLIL